jgi:hypothetical protein
MPRIPAGISEEVAAEALSRALQDQCLGASWRGLARGLAWRVVSGGDRNPHSIDLLANTAEAMLVALIDEALWAVEQVVVQVWQESFDASPGDEEAALAAVRLRAFEESVRLVDSACERVLETLLAVSRRRAA